MIAYAANCGKQEWARGSSSGGVFTAIARDVLKNGGIVVGAAWSKDWKRVTHIGIDRISELHRLQGSKYVQSDMSRTYSLIEKALANGKLVLFSGMPCQVAAVKNRFQGDGKLLTVDLVCHGVPGEKLFSDYFSWLESIRWGKISSICFRNKRYGWDTPCGNYEIRRFGRIYKEILDTAFSSYFALFMRGEIYRKVCYCCQYAKKERVGDISICDFWGIEEECPDLLKKIDKSDGVSGLLVNTSEGERLVEVPKLMKYPVEISAVMAHNNNLNRPSVYTELRKYVLQAYETDGWKGVEETYLRYCGINRYYNHFIYSMLKTFRNQIRGLRRENM